MEQETHQKSAHDCLSQHACMECAYDGDTCCVEMCVPLMIEDIDRICALNHRLEDFAELRDYADEDESDHEDWWNAARIALNGGLYRIVLKAGADGNCPFLRPGQGCVLGPNRPLTCRMYPYWISPEGAVVLGDQDCPIVTRAPEVEQGLEMIDETAVSLRRHHRRIIDDCRQQQSRAAEIVRRLAGVRSAAD